jgi:hypothetical protein
MALQVVVQKKERSHGNHVGNRERRSNDGYHADRIRYDGIEPVPLPIPARARKLPYDHARYRERDRTERFAKRAAALPPAMANRRPLPCRSLQFVNRA